MWWALLLFRSESDDGCFFFFGLFWLFVGVIKWKRMEKKETYEAQNSMSRKLYESVLRAAIIEIECILYIYICIDYLSFTMN